jgi:heme-degrading monooxygenase HmoA
MSDEKPLHPHGIARIWKGRTSPANADLYTRYMYDHGVKKLESLGARGVQFFREDATGYAEFMVVSLWDTVEAMTRWAGTDPRKIRHLERDPELLLDLPDHVQILDVYSNSIFLSDAFR